MDSSGQRSLASIQVAVQTKVSPGEEPEPTSPIPLQGATVYTGFLRIFPNPVNGTIQIEYTLAQAGKVIIDVYNILGRKVASILAREQGQGDQQVRCAPAGLGPTPLSSGMYFLCVESGKTQQVRKIWLVK